tara:strand:- start:1084 stop:1818 length:735 start_codon:yes stop_codon:yes gene_type:complete
MSNLKNHLFAVEAFFKSSVVLAFAVPKEELEAYIPPCLELDTYQDKWAFVALATVQTTNLRPKGFPSFLGNDFFLIGIRVFVRYKDIKGRSLRGLYILKSITNKKKMEFLGNIFTHYNYSTTDIGKFYKGDIRTLYSKKSKFSITINDGADEPDLPVGSPFETWKEAKKFSGPLPFTYTYNEKDKSVLIIEGVRKNWKPIPLEIADYEFSFLSDLNITNAVLANAFEVKEVPYYWKKGRLERWG